jgi:hypothetical protein
MFARKEVKKMIEEKRKEITPVERQTTRLAT